MLTLRECASGTMRRIRSAPRLRALLIAILTIGVGGWVASTPYLLHGLTRHYYDNAEWAGQPATTVRDRTLRLEGSDFPWYGSWYSVEWTGVLYIATDDIYHFTLTSDDGAGLWIDDIQVIDNDTMHAAATAEGNANLARGFRRIRVRYVQYDDEVAFSASWRPSGRGADADSPLATAMLFPRAPSLAMFGVYRVGRGLAAAGTMALLVVLVVLPIGWAVWALAGRRSRHQWSATVGRAAGQWTVRAILVLGSLGVALVGAETTLRAVYRDNGRTTSGGPGGAQCAYTLPRWSTDYRIGGPNADAARAPGTTRILVQGDSITWGQGVADGTLLYPSRLLAKLREVGSYYMTVQAEPGRAIDEHVLLLDRGVGRLEPDVIIYQWFVNDIVRYEWFRRYQETGGAITRRHASTPSSTGCSTAASPRSSRAVRMQTTQATSPRTDRDSGSIFERSFTAKPRARPPTPVTSSCWSIPCCPFAVSILCPIYTSAWRPPLGHRSGRSPRSRQTDASARTRRRSSPVTGRSEGEAQACEASSSHSETCRFGAAGMRSRFGCA